MAEPVTGVADARAALSQILRRFRADPQAPDVVIGANRKPEAVLVPIARRATGADAPSGAFEFPRGMLERLHAKRDLILRIAALDSVRDVRVFGSVARGEERASSDVDLLVEPEDEATLFDLAQFEMDMEALLERPVHVVSIRSLDPERDAGIVDEAVPL